MEFIQQTIDDVIQNPLSIHPLTFNRLDGEGKIYAKLDYASIMFYDCCMNDVLYLFHLEDLIDDFLLGFYHQIGGSTDEFRFNYGGLMLHAAKFDFYGCNVDLNIFDKVVPSLRLNISGIGLDMLRSRGLDPDVFLRQPFELCDGQSYVFTRIDFAFDFINYKADFLDKLIDHVLQNALPSGRLPLYKKGSGIDASVKLCGEKTVNLGSKQSDKLLRVYDKRLEQLDKKTQVYKTETVYGFPESWIRIEWQLRNATSHKYAQGVDVNGHYMEAKNVLKDIFLCYAFAEGLSDNKHRHNIKPIDFWGEFLPWEEIERRIIQNAKYVEYKEPKDVFIERWRRYGLKNYMLVKHLIGADGIDKMANEELQELQTDPMKSRAYVSLLNKINYYGLYIDDETQGFKNLCGRLVWN